MFKPRRSVAYVCRRGMAVPKQQVIVQKQANIRVAPCHSGALGLLNGAQSMAQGHAEVVHRSSRCPCLQDVTDFGICLVTVAVEPFCIHARPVS